MVSQHGADRKLRVPGANRKLCVPGADRNFACPGPIGELGAPVANPLFEDVKIIKHCVSGGQLVCEDEFNLLR